MSADESAETVTCRACGGSGRILVVQCAEIVNGRRCKNTASGVLDPEYFEEMPERAHFRSYCGMHRNMRLRAEHQ